MTKVEKIKMLADKRKHISSNKEQITKLEKEKLEKLKSEIDQDFKNSKNNKENCTTTIISNKIEKSHDSDEENHKNKGTPLKNNKNLDNFI